MAEKNPKKMKPFQRQGEKVRINRDEGVLSHRRDFFWRLIVIAIILTFLSYFVSAGIRLYFEDFELSTFRFGAFIIADLTAAYYFFLNLVHLIGTTDDWAYIELTDQHISFVNPTGTIIKQLSLNRIALIRLKSKKMKNAKTRYVSKKMGFEFEMIFITKFGRILFSGAIWDKPEILQLEKAIFDLKKAINIPSLKNINRKIK